MAFKEVEGEIDQSAHGRDRLEAVEIECLLGRADFGVDVLEHREIEPVLVAEIGVQQPHVGLRALRDGFDPGSTEAVAAELERRRTQDGFLCQRGIARASAACGVAGRAGWCGHVGHGATLGLNFSASARGDSHPVRWRD